MTGLALDNPISALVSTLRSVRRKGRTWASVLFDQALVSGTNFLTTVLIARLLGKQQLGLYVLAYSIVVVLLEVQNSFIASPYTMNCSRLDGPAQARYTGSAFALTIGLSGVATAVLLAGSAVFPVGLGDPGLRIVFLNLALIVTPLLAKEFARRACFAHFRTREVLLLDGLVSLIQIGGLFLLAKLGSPSVRSVYWLIAIASGTAVIVWITSWRNRTVITLAGAFHTLRATWSFGTWVLTGNLALVLSQQIYPWYLASFKGPAITGTFAACLGLFALINPLVSAIGNYLGPATASASSRGGRVLSRTVLRATVLVSGVVGLFCFVTVLLGNHLLLLLYGSGYKVEFHLIVVLAVSVLVSNATLALGFGFWALNRPDMNLKINLLSTATAVILGPWLVSRYGLLGAAYGLLIANTAVSAFRVLHLRRMLPAT